MYELSEDQIQELVTKSLEGAKYSYSPYSGFPVGAALLCEDGSLYTGSNVENVSYGLGICAERTAIVKAVSEGKLKFKAIAIISPALDDFISPCGACRQFLLEFGDDFDVFLCRKDLSYKKYKASELLPQNFTKYKLLNSHRV